MHLGYESPLDSSIIQSSISVLCVTYYCLHQCFYVKLHNFVCRSQMVCCSVSRRQQHTIMYVVFFLNWFLHKLAP